MRDEVSAITHLRAVPDKLPLIRPRTEPQAPSPKWGKAFHYTKEGYTMIYCLTGKIIKKTLDSVVISCGGVLTFFPLLKKEALYETEYKK